MTNRSVPTLHISKALIRDGERYLLILRARYSEYYPSVWDFAGGKDEPGETPAESVVRETLEETSLTIEPGHEVRTETYSDTAHTLVFHYFHPRVLSGAVTLSADHEQFGWFTRDEIKKFSAHPSVSCYFAQK